MRPTPFDGTKNGLSVEKPHQVDNEPGALAAGRVMWLIFRTRKPRFVSAGVSTASGGLIVRLPVAGGRRAGPSPRLDEPGRSRSP
jgi:hypothetical protein